MSAKTVSPISSKPNQILVLEPYSELKFKGLSFGNVMTLMTTPLRNLLYYV